mmetsp:Transcript_49494/g.120168  ORF Transcript_49494/g.120168 Transcript_49494/m.120168 type:complete len:245 (+) Transcript_49494:242-976(+)
MMQESPAAATTAAVASSAVTGEDDVYDGSDRDEGEEELTRRRIRVIKTSWRAVQLGVDVKAAEIFYDRLFTKYPQVRDMFPEDMRTQHFKLYSTVSLVVDGIEDIDTLVPTIEDLGRRHAKWGVVRAHYEGVVDCFLWTLQQYIFSFMPNNNAINWFRNVTDAWEWALRFIGGTMADAADAAQEEEARICDHNEAFEYCCNILREEKRIGSTKLLTTTTAAAAAGDNKLREESESKSSKCGGAN